MAARRKQCAPRRFEDTLIAVLQNGDDQDNEKKKPRIADSEEEEEERDAEQQHELHQRLANVLGKACTDPDVFLAASSKRAGLCKMLIWLLHGSQDSHTAEGDGIVWTPEENREWSNNEWAKEMSSLVLQGASIFLQDHHDQEMRPYLGIYRETLEALTALGEERAPHRPNRLLGYMYLHSARHEIATWIERWEYCAFLRMLEYFRSTHSVEIVVQKNHAEMLKQAIK